MDYNETKERRKRSKRRWNFIGIALLFSFLPAPIGIGILVANAMDILPNIGGKVDIQKSVDNLASDVRSRSVNRPVAEVPEQTKRVNGMPQHRGRIPAPNGIRSENRRRSFSDLAALYRRLTDPRQLRQRQRKQSRSFGQAPERKLLFFAF